MAFNLKLLSKTTVIKLLKLSTTFQGKVKSMTYMSNTMVSYS